MIYKMYKDVPLSTYIRLKRLIWADHVVRLEQHRVSKKVLGSFFWRRKASGETTKWMERCHTEGCSQPAPDSELEGCSKR
jgi:hypothetical protein